jgi:hypothetical protein
MRRLKILFGVTLIMGQNPPVGATELSRSEASRRLVELGLKKGK